MRVTIFDCTKPEWADAAKRAKASGVSFAEAVAPYTGGRGVDRDANLCAVQREQQAAGYIAAELGRNIYGYCIRDTMNDGGGRLSPNMTTALEAVLWAREWHAKAPDKRTVSVVLQTPEDLSKMSLSSKTFNREVRDALAELAILEAGEGAANG
jgi:hypothetical protein